MIFTIALYNHNISCLFSSSCKCHTLDIQLAPWIFSWHSHTMFQQQLSGGCWHWKRTTSAALEPGNDCGKLRHPPLPEHTLSSHPPAHLPSHPLSLPPVTPHATHIFHTPSILSFPRQKVRQEAKGQMQSQKDRQIARPMSRTYKSDSLSSQNIWVELGGQV